MCCTVLLGGAEGVGEQLLRLTPLLTEFLHRLRHATHETRELLPPGCTVVSPAHRERRALWAAGLRVSPIALRRSPAITSPFWRRSASSWCGLFLARSSASQ